MNLTIQLDDQEAWSFAEIIKRIGYDNVRLLSKDDEEARNALAAIEKIRKELARNGIDPR